MRTISSLRIIIGISLLSVFALAPASPCASAQDQRGRGIKYEVGTTTEELSAGRKADLWAVIIGVSLYKNGEQNVGGNRIPNLKHAASDSQAIYDFLRSPEGGGFTPASEGGHMILLKDEQATKVNVESALARLKQSKPDDYFVIYIAAHGTVVPQRNPQTNKTEEVPYFLVHDTDTRSMQGTALRMMAFQEAIKQIPAKKGMVLSDTCHSAGVQLAGRGLHTEDTKRGNTGLIKTMESLEGIGFISAADQTELSYESDKFSEGVFTHCLLEGLGGNADSDQNGIVTFEELKKYLRVEVPKLTEGQQNPAFNTTTLEANKIPLSLVRYPEAGDMSDAGEGLGLLVIRTPEIDGVEVSVDGKPLDKVNSMVERRVRVSAGIRKLSFVKGTFPRRDLPVTVKSGEAKIIEVNLAFSDSNEDEPTDQQTNVFLREDKEPSKEAKDRFVKGVESFNKQRFAEAIELFTRAAQANGGAYSEALVYRGRSEQSLGRDKAAVMSFTEALKLRPSDFQTRALLNEARFQSGDQGGVVKELDDIIARHPKFDYAHVVLGDVLFYQGDLIRAEMHLRKATLINPNSPPAHMILADVLMSQNSKEKRSESVEEAQKALDLFEKLSTKQHSASTGLKRLSISHVIFGGARYINQPVMAEAHHILARALNEVVERDAPSDSKAILDRARMHIQEAMNRAKGLPDKRRLAFVLVTSAHNYRLKGDLAQAVADANLALKTSDPIPDMKDFAEAHLVLAEAYESDQKYAKALEHLQKFIASSGSQLEPDKRKECEEKLIELRRLKDANRQK